MPEFVGVYYLIVSGIVIVFCLVGFCRARRREASDKEFLPSPSETALEQSIREAELKKGIRTRSVGGTPQWPMADVPRPAGLMYYGVGSYPKVDITAFDAYEREFYLARPRARKSKKKEAPLEEFPKRRAFFHNKEDDAS